MKKFNEPEGDLYPFMKKILLIMRLSVILILIAVFTSTASVYSQATQLSLKMEEARLSEVFDAIEKQSEFFFFYNRDVIDDQRIVSLEFENTGVENVLAEIFKDGSVTYEIFDRNILLKINEDLPSESAQQRVVSGTVTDGTGMTLPGVTVMVKGTSNGTVTNIDGEYSLSGLPEDAVLRFSFIGMITQEVPVNNQSTISVVMQEDAIGIEEVVVIGYGTLQRKNLIGSVDQVNAEIIENRPVGNTVQALQGASANLVIQQRSMNPNDNSMNINIRGVSTMNNNDPLIVIDGMISEIGSLNALNPNDIENISVLKDAGSSAIYGSRSANGVILVTTRKGSKSQRPVVRINTMTGIQEPEVLYSPVSGYENALLKNQMLLNAGSTPQYTPAQIRDFQDNGDGQWFVNGILRTAVQHNYNASISGGSDNSTYMISAGYYNQESNFTGDFGIERYNFRSNLVSEYGKLRVSSIMAYNRTMQTAPNAGTGTLIVDGGRIPPYYTYRMKADNGKYLINDVLSEFNPLGMLEAGGFHKHDNDNFLGNLKLELELAEGLSAEGLVGLDLSSNHRFIRSKEVPFYSSPTAVQPSSYANLTRNTEDYNEKRYILNTQFLLNYNQTFNEDHNVSGLIGVSNESYTRQANEIKLRYTDRDLGLPETETEYDPSSYNTPAQTQERSIYSLFGRAGYNFRDKYYGEVSFRYDGSSKFSEDYRWGFFPSFTAGWRMSEENFMEGYKNRIGDLKLRGSYGILGNQNVDDYAYFTTYTVYNNIYGFNNEAVAGTGFDFGNSMLQWEQSATANIGIDATFFDYKLSASVDYFDKLTSQILLTPAVPAVFGGAVAKENAGEMRNRGWEATINYHTKTGAFNHNIRLNIADAKNEVVDFGGDEQINSSDQLLKLIREGEALGSYFGYKTDGYFSSYEDIENSPLPIGATVQPGDVKYRDVNDDGVIDEKDRVVLGNAFPRYTFGLNYDLTWKGFDLGLFIQGVGKRNMFLRGELVEPFHANYSYVIYEHQLDFWTPVNPNSKWPRLSAPGSSSQQNNWAKASDIYLFDAAYARLKNVQLGYTLPNELTSRAGIQKVRLHVNAQNLFTLSRIPFIDPESTEFGSNMGGTGGTGANSGRNYPTLRYYGFGLNIEF